MADNTEPVEFERGDKVKHPKWGLGSILYKSGAGNHCKVIVLFQDVGQKTLAVKHANMEKVASSPMKARKAIIEKVIPVEHDEVVEPMHVDEPLELGEDEEKEEEDL